MSTLALLLIIISAVMHAFWNLLVKRSRDKTVFIWWMFIASGTLVSFAVPFVGPFPPLTPALFRPDRSRGGTVKSCRQMSRVLLLTLGVLLAGCGMIQPPPPPPPPDPAFAALAIRSVAVGPVAYATYQPTEMCSAFIDEELRSALVRELRRRGYDAFSVGNSVPRSFAAGTPAP